MVFDSADLSVAVRMVQVVPKGTYCYYLLCLRPKTAVVGDHSVYQDCVREKIEAELRNSAQDLQHSEKD